MEFKELMCTLTKLECHKPMICMTTTNHNEYEVIGVRIPESELINHDWDNEEVNHFSYDNEKDIIFIDLSVSESNKHYAKYVSCLNAIIERIDVDNPIEHVIEEMIAEMASRMPNEDKDIKTKTKDDFFVDLEQEKLRKLAEMINKKTNSKDNSGKDKENKK